MYVIKPTWKTEKAFQKSVLTAAKTFGWAEYSIPDTAYSAKIKRTHGWPDLTLCRPPSLIFAELKLNGNYPTQAQKDWAKLLQDCGQEYYLWKPRDWDFILRRLQSL